MKYPDWYQKNQKLIDYVENEISTGSLLSAHRKARVWENGVGKHYL